MSNEEKLNQAKAAANETKAKLAELAGRFLSLKDSNPKVFYGAVGGVVVLILASMMMGGDSGVIANSTNKNLAIGQSYILKNANAGSTGVTALVAVPGNMAAYDNSTQDETTSGLVCQAPDGSQIRIKGFADAFGKKNLFAQVEVESGSCQGKTGWTIVNNIQG